MTDIPPSFLHDDHLPREHELTNSSRCGHTSYGVLYAGEWHMALQSLVPPDTRWWIIS